MAKQRSTKALVAELRTLEVAKRAIMDDLQERYSKGKKKKCLHCGRDIPWDPAHSYMIDANGMPPTINCDCLEDMG